MTDFWCRSVKRRIRALIPISLLLIACLAAPVSAFYFDFQYFETDKLVYEVGETINMVAKLIADFSNQGWSYVSFAVVTDLGPAFTDEYFIPPSPDVRYLNSSYTILPEHTTPNATGVQAFVLFNIEIFDTISQGAGDNIEITIVRGHLDVIPKTPLIVQSEIDTTLSFKVESIHNSSVVYADEILFLQVEDFNSQPVLNANLSTTTEGLTSLNWNDSLGPPGLYNLTLSSNGNDDFLPFSDSFQVTVLPALSNLSIISSPTFIHCQSPDGSLIEQADIIVEHIDLNLNSINDSTIIWETSFGNGSMTNQGNGQYSTTIPFETSPGTHLVNITASNPQFQIVKETTSINVLPNSLQFSPLQPSWNVTRGQNVTIEFLIEFELDWNQSVNVQFIDGVNEFSLESEIYHGISSYLVISTSSNYSIGSHIVNVSTNSEYYSFQNTSQFILDVIGIMNLNISINSAFYRESLNFTLTILDDNTETVDFIDIFVFYDNSIIPFTAINYVNSNIVHSISLPVWLSLGLHNISFRVESDYFHHIYQTLTVQVWMRTDISIVITISNGRD